MRNAPSLFAICLFCAAVWTFPALAAQRPTAYLTFPETVCSSGDKLAAFGNVRGGEISGGVDLYATIEAKATGGDTTLRYLDEQGKLQRGICAYKLGFKAAGEQFPIALITQPTHEKGSTHPVVWRLYLVRTGLRVESQEELERVSLTETKPTPLTIASTAYNGWTKFSVLRASLTESGIRIFAEVRDGGAGYSFYVGDDAAERLLKLDGPKLILISGLGCSAASWLPNFNHSILTGALKPGGNDITYYLPLMKHYKYVAFFEYKSAGDLEGPDISGRFAEAMRTARPEDRIDIISHSMGGLVTRCYVELFGGHQVIDNAVLMESPLNGVENGAYKGLTSLIPAGTLTGSLSGISPLAKMLKGSPLYRRLNAPWETLTPPASLTGFGKCKYYCIAAGAFGTGTDRLSAKSWFDRQSEFFPDEIRAESALWLPLGDGKVGELDSTGGHELLLISPSKEDDHYIAHNSFVGHMADTEHNGAGLWIRMRLWPDAE